MASRDKEGEGELSRRGTGILCVGLLCIDIVNVCKQFPKEDSDTRCLDQNWVRGGNASNNCTVLKQLGAECEFFGTVAKIPISQFLMEDFKANGIKTDNCIYMERCDCPTSVAIINSQTGSRTILHSNKNLPELSWENFRDAINLSNGQYSWIQFEGRYTATEIKKMLEMIDKFNKNTRDNKKRIITSVELEKMRPELGELIECADYVFVSKGYSKMHGYKNKEEAVNGFCIKVRQGASVICAWGEDGAAAKTNTGSSTLCITPAFPPEKVVDTLGAGDTFIASTIYALNNGYSLESAITFGCKVAGAKVGINGFRGLRDITF